MTSFLYPTDANTSGSPLTADHVHAWRVTGATVVDGVLPLALIDSTRSAALKEFAGTPAGERNDFGSGGRFVFPSEHDDFNAITLHPRLLGAVAQLLACAVNQLRLTQSDLWVKRGRDHPVDDPYDNTDQRIHVDYPNHTLVHPPMWDTPEAVEVIIYMDDHRGCDGETAVVLRNGDNDPAYPWPIVNTPGVGEFEWINNRGRAEEYLEARAPAVAQWRREHLYAREQRVAYGIGTVLLYRHDTWHRGTPVRAGTTRVAHNLTFRKAASEWVNTLHEGWTWAMYRRRRTMERLIATASVEQRSVLGFPPPDSPYWSPETLDAVTQRYGPLGFDPAPYHAAEPPTA